MMPTYLFVGVVVYIVGLMILAVGNMVEGCQTEWESCLMDEKDREISNLNYEYINDIRRVSKG